MKPVKRQPARQRRNATAFPERRHREFPEQAVTATQVKNEFGRVLEKAIQGETVVITRHNTPKAVLISMDHFNALKHAPEAKLATLSGEFDALLSRMQGAQARAAMKTAFAASPRQLGKAAVLATRKHG